MKTLLLNAHEEKVLSSILVRDNSEEAREFLRRISYATSFWFESSNISKFNYHDEFSPQSTMELIDNGAGPSGVKINFLSKPSTDGLLGIVV